MKQEVLKVISLILVDSNAKLVTFNVSSVQTVSIRVTRDYKEYLTVNKFSFVKWLLFSSYIESETE